MPEVEVGLRLKRVGQAQDLRLAEQFAGEMQRGWRSVREAVWDAQDWVARAVGQRLVAADEQIEIAERLIHLLHHARAVAIRLNEVDGGNEMSGANFVGPSALLRSVFHGRQDAGARRGVERRRRFRVADEIERLD